MQAEPEFIVGIDTGGTFTDCVVIEGSTGRVLTSKALSTPADFSIGLFESLDRAAREVGLSADELLQQTSQMVVGTTVGTNSFLERKGATTGMLTTRGFRDTLSIMRGIGRVIGRPPEEALLLETTGKPEPLVPKRLIREVDERVDSEGEVLVAPDRSKVMEDVRELLAADVDAISICFLWAFKESSNEAAVRDWINEAHPDVYVSCSHEVAPKLGEFERFAGTTINAYVGPKTKRYLEHIAGAVREKGYDQKLLVMGCDGGVRSARVAAEEAIITLNSGPAGGVTGSAALAAQLGIDNVVTADVGGTSFDVGLIKDGHIQSGDKTVLGQYEFFIPAIDVQGIGAGGGSIAWIDERRGTLSVGPESAGADPGPVCYGRGATRPTLTDAALCLGYLSEQSFLGKGGRLDAAAARAALAELGAQVDLSWEETAAGIVRIAESHMSDLARRMLVSGGHDPRDFALFAYGGAGPVHATGFARDLDLASIVVPAGNSASVWSAFGVATSDIKHVYEYASVFAEPLDAGAIRDVYAGLAENARSRIADEAIGTDETHFRYEAGLRYKGQLHEVYVGVADGAALDEESVARVVDDFEVEYSRVYGEGTAFAEAGIELVDFRLTTITPVRRPQLKQVERTAQATVKGTREVRFVGLDAGISPAPVTAEVYDGEALGAGTEINGAAMIELPGTTIGVPPDYSATRHESGSYVLTSV